MASRNRNPLLSSRDGRLLALTQLAHALAQGVVAVAVPWAVLEAGGSVTAAGLSFAVTFVPFLVLSVPAGLAGDRAGRRGLLAAALLAAAVIAAGVAAWTWLGSVPVAALYAAAFGIGAARVFVDAAMFGAVAALVGRADLLPAQAALSASFNLGFYGGPAVGGIALAIGGGAAFVLVAAALLTGGLAAFLMSARVEARPAAVALRPRRGLGHGLAALFLAPGLRAITLTGVAWSVASGAVITLAVPHLRSGLGAGGVAMGVALAGGVAVMMLSAPLVARLDRRLSDTRILAGACIAYSVPALAFGLSTSIGVAALAYGPMMLANAVCAATLMGARARRVPADMQALAGVAGRTLVIGGLAAGSALGSLLAGGLSTSGAYVAASLVLLVIGLVAWRGLHTATRQWDGRRPLAHAR